MFLLFRDLESPPTPENSSSTIHRFREPNFRLAAWNARRRHNSISKAVSGAAPLAAAGGFSGRKRELEAAGGLQSSFAAR